MSTSAHSHVRLTLYPPMSGLSFGFVNNVTAPHTGKRRKMKLSQKAGRISVPYLPANRSEWDELLPSIHTWGHHREVNEINNWTSKFNLNLHMDLQSPTLLCQRTGCALRILIFCFSGCVVRGGACRRVTGGGGDGPHLSLFQQWTHSCWHRESRPRTSPEYGTLSCHREQRSN